MQRVFLTLFLLLSSTLALAAASDSLPSSVAVPSSTPKTPLPARQSKHRRIPIRTHKRSSAATSRAKRTPPLPTTPSTPVDDSSVPGLDSIGGLGDLSDLAGGASPAGGLGALPLPMEKEKRSSPLDILGSLTSSSNGMSASQQKLNAAAQRATKYKDSHMNSAFQNSVYQELKAYRGSAAGLPGLAQLDSTLKPLGPDQGLANFDRNNNLEVLIRTVSTGFQDTLESVNLIVFQIPVLGPVLGPIVYDIKCIIDDILNILQVILDGALNQLSPQLGVISGNYLESTCKMGPSLPCCD